MMHFSQPNGVATMQVLNNQDLQLISGGDAAHVIACVDDLFVAIDDCIGIVSPTLSQILKAVITAGQQIAAEDGPAIQAAVINAINEIKTFKL